jgi:hypothetical protein
MPMETTEETRGEEGRETEEGDFLEGEEGRGAAAGGDCANAANSSATARPKSAARIPLSKNFADRVPCEAACIPERVRSKKFLFTP